MHNCLIGYSGFVGSTLLNQHDFDEKYRSTNIHEIKGKKFSTVVCSAAPAKKWIANANPEEDLQNIELLISNLETIDCELFILISTVDVFKNPFNVDEDSPIDENGLHPYGLNRRLLEKFVENKFQNYLIVRLAGLVGPGLSKNVIYDFLHNNNLHSIESRNIYQFYPMVNLWYDIQLVVKENLKVIHLTAAPISVSDLARLAFDKEFKQELSGNCVAYDFRTKYASLFGDTAFYQYSVRESIQAIRSYVQFKQKSLKIKNQG